MSEIAGTSRSLPEKRSINPLFWLPFGAGGMLAALFGPALVLLTGFLIPEGLGWPNGFASYESALGFARNPFGKLILLVVIALFFWHGAERVFLTLKDAKVGTLRNLKIATYGVAAGATVITLIMLLVIGF